MAIELDKIEALKRINETEKLARDELRKAEHLLNILDSSGYKSAKDLIADLKQIDGSENELRDMCKQYLTAAGALTVPSPGTTRKRLSAEDKMEVVQMLTDGSTAKEVAYFFNVSTATINKIKKDAGLTSTKKARMEAATNL